jgi:hypothetical protein
VVPIDLEKLAQRRAGVAAAEAVGAERDVAGVYMRGVTQGAWAEATW